MLQKLRSNSRSTEVGAATTRITKAYKNANLTTDSYLDGLITGLSAENNLLTKAIDRSKTESQLEEKDEVRDDKLRALYYFLLGQTNHPGPAVRSAAETLMPVFDKYGLAIVNDSYATETTLVKSLLDDLGEASLEVSITAVAGTAELIAQLQAAQDDFENFRVVYQTEKGKEEKLESATSIKKRMVRTINDKLVVHLRAMLNIDEALYGGFVGAVSTIIAENNEEVKKRRKKPEPAA
ncbi:DUF6261 family protein [Prolixibacter sp. SD074]|uniref:DUF6261 family protein n=1 Tax=Prolixibacter sp. SD074 TaxID=2652391 RepID=UPI001279D9C5|nr:DUF6261 family protein [Prolixibacter sp. SD074]GET28555.1 hypothetical protein SD074_07570 [Prolixibacter sp. SD074]